MALAFGSALGSGNQVGSPATTASFSTTGAVAAGGKIIVGVSWYNNVTVSVAGGSLSWTQDESFNSADDANRRAALFSADAPAGLASSTSITVTASGNAFNLGLCGAYITGAATASWEDIGGGSSSASSGTMSVSITTTTADTAVFFFGWAEFASVGSTPLSTYSEAVDFINSVDGALCALDYRIVSSTGTYTPGATFDDTGSHGWVGVAVAYKADAGGAVAGSPFKPRRMPLGV